MNPGTWLRSAMGQRLTLIALLALAVVLAFLPLLQAGWVYDDVNLVRPSPALEDLAGLGRAISTDLYSQAGARLEVSAYWRPLAMASFWLDTRFGEAPKALHLGNILLHAIAAALLALVILRRHAAPAGLVAATAAAWWALHPQNVEVVAWISCRYEILTAIALLVLLALPRTRGVWSHVLFGLVFLVGLLAKESFVAVLAVVVALDVAERPSVREAGKRWCAVGLALALWLSLRALVGIKGLDAPPPGAMLAIAFNYLEAVALYSWRAFAFPPLTISHPFINDTARLLAGALIVVALAAAALWWRSPMRQHRGAAERATGQRRLAVPVAVFLAGLVPMAGAITLFAEAPERYFYLPSLGLALLLAEVLAWAWSRNRALVRFAVPAVVGVVIVYGLVLIERRLPDWRSETALWAAALRIDPLDAQANYSIALAEGRKGNWGEARRALQIATQAKPGSARIANAYAWVLVETGDFTGAAREAQRATELAPFDPNGWYYLAFASHKSGDHARELAAVEKLLEVAPNYPGAKEMRAVATCEVQGGRNCLRGR